MNSQHRIGLSDIALTLVISFVIAFTLIQESHAVGYTGRIGDNIDYYSGTLSLSEVDVVVPGRHGLDVVIARSYSSQFYPLDMVDSAHQLSGYATNLTPEKYRYLGQGWHIEFPYLHNNVTRSWVDFAHSRTVSLVSIVNQDGSEEIMFRNPDTLTNAQYPQMTTSYALFTGRGPSSATPDTLLRSDGSRWIFDHTASGDKFLTKIVNIYGDTLKVEYYNGSRWIKKVVSAIGREVIFRYGNRVDTTLLPYNLTPPDTARLYELQYLNHNDSTLSVKYHFFGSSKGANLKAVIRPTGDSTWFDYDNHYLYQTQADWDSWCTDNCSSRNTGTVWYLSTYTDGFGASVSYQYKYVNRPVLAKPQQDCGVNPDLCVQYQGYISVIRRVAGLDTLKLRYQICKDNLRQMVQFPFDVGSRTLATFSNGNTAEYYFFVDELGGYDPTYTTSTYLNNGAWPTALFQENLINGKDTMCTGYDYTFKDHFATVGWKGWEVCDTFWASMNPPVVDSFRVTYVDSGKIYAPSKIYAHQGVGLYKEAHSPVEPLLTRNSDQGWISSVTLTDPLRSNLTLLKVSGARYSKYLLNDADSLNEPGYARCPWASNCSSCGDTICYPLPVTDTIPFVKDSVLQYQYVPAWNLLLVTKTKQITQNHGKVVGVYTEYEYDSTRCYQLSRMLTYLDTTYFDSGLSRTSTVTYIESYQYDQSGNLTRKISAANDTTYYAYDPTYGAFLYRVIDSAFGGGGAAILTEQGYYPNGFLKLSIGLNSDTTYFYYDQYGRALGVKRPLESDTSIVTQYDNANNKVTSREKIDQGLTITTVTYKDAKMNTVKNMLRVSDSVNIVDSMVYDSLGLLTKSGRSKYSNDTTSWAWTEYKYDKSFRRYKTIAPGATLSDSICYRDLYTTDYRSASGQKTRVRTDMFGNTLYTYVGDSTGCDTCFSAIDTASATYGPFGNPLQTTDLKGLTRTYAYDAWGRRIKIVDPDIGTKRVWYDRAGRIRFVKSNTLDSCNYFKYDADGRLAEEGTVNNPDTTKVDSLAYPGAGVASRKVWATYRYDSYSTSQIAADTIGGLKYCKGRLTQVVDSSGYTYYYYDKRGRMGLKTTFVKELTAAKKLRFQYYANDALKRITYPDTTKHTDYSYFQTGQLRGVSDIIGQDSISYEGWGAVKEIRFKNNLKSKCAYDNLGRLAKTINYGGASKYFSRVYTYDATKGYLVKEQDSDTLGNGTDSTRSYTYDYLGRLTRAWLKAPPSYGAPERTVNYEYDPNNNLTFRKIAGRDSLYYSFTSNTNFNSKVRINDNACYLFTKDDRGRTTQMSISSDTVGSGWYARKQFRYDHRSLLTTVVFEQPSYETGDHPDSVVNLYDASGHKVKQIFSYYINVNCNDTIDPIKPPREGMQGGGDSLSSSTLSGGFQTDATEPPPSMCWVRRQFVRYYIWAGNQVILELDNPTTVTEINIYGLGKQLARRYPTRGADSLHILVSDYHGSLRSDVAFAGGTGSDLMEYYPYGEFYMLSGSNSTGREFIGKEYDRVRELDFGPRYYNSTIGHFLSPDPILSAPSAYAYTDGNPVMQYDPTGLEASPWTMSWFEFMSPDAIAERDRKAEQNFARNRDLAQRDAETAAWFQRVGEDNAGSARECENRILQDRKNSGNATKEEKARYTEIHQDGFEWGHYRWVVDETYPTTSSVTKDEYGGDVLVVNSNQDRGHFENVETGGGGSNPESSLEERLREDPLVKDWLENGPPGIGCGGLSGMGKSKPVAGSAKFILKKVVYWANQGKYWRFGVGDMPGGYEGLRFAGKWVEWTIERFPWLKQFSNDGNHIDIWKWKK